MDNARLLGTGVYRYAQGQVSEALWDFLEATGQDPADPLSHYLCGLALRALGLREEARAEWGAVIALELHQTVLEDASPCPDRQWARAMAQRLLRQDIGEGE